ncbi:hypothetical protein O181_094540 [Austropuccinia psidii MF-1]|uniref:Uncharacterized protein n=1 Tax=Austropuccinia psidii MF-1 TaxID=1389203 RepID=A0A9Q3PB63_9BASI|nr:hypothetical protein [Austropuccinia psidii MF-1]
MLDRWEIRQQSNKAHKAHNVAKRASQKEQKEWLKAELPENVHGMRSAVHAHCLLLLKVRDKDFSSLTAPPSTEEREIAIQVAGHLGYAPRMFSMSHQNRFSLRASKATANMSSTSWD